MDMNKNCDLKINEEVIAKIASMAALEIEGVDSMCEDVPVTVKNILNRVGALKSVSVGINGDVIYLDVYLCIKESANAKAVAEAVQVNVKEKVQNMTGSVVTKVNVFIADTAPDEEPEEE